MQSRNSNQNSTTLQTLGAVSQTVDADLAQRNYYCFSCTINSDFTFQLDNKDSGGPGDHFAPELDLSSEQTLQAEIGTTADLDASLADEQREQQVFADSANTNVVVACDNAREPLAVAHEQSAPQVGGGERRMEVVGEPTTDSTTKTTLPIETSTKPPRP